MVKFTESMIVRGFEQGLINLIISPNGDGVACKIGDGILSNWFYFGGLTAAECNTVEQFQKIVPQEDIIRAITETLNNFYQVDEDEQLFYYYALKQI